MWGEKGSFSIRDATSWTTQRLGRWLWKLPGSWQKSLQAVAADRVLQEVMVDRMDLEAMGQ